MDPAQSLYDIGSPSLRPVLLPAALWAIVFLIATTAAKGLAPRASLITKPSGITMFSHAVLGTYQPGRLGKPVLSHLLLITANAAKPGAWFGGLGHLAGIELPAVQAVSPAGWSRAYDRYSHDIWACATSRTNKDGFSWPHLPSVEEAQFEARIAFEQLQAIQARTQLAHAAV